MSTLENVRGAEEPRLMHFPVSFFSVITGLGGLTLAWKVTGQIVAPYAWQWIGVLTSSAMLVITLSYALKIIKHPQAVLAESRHPIRLNFFPAF